MAERPRWRLRCPTLLRRTMTLTDRATGEVEVVPFDWTLKRAIYSWLLSRLSMRLQSTELPCGCTKSFGRFVLFAFPCSENHGDGGKFHRIRGWRP